MESKPMGRPKKEVKEVVAGRELVPIEKLCKEDLAEIASENKALAAQSLLRTEAARLLGECKTIRPIIQAAILTGMRLNEILTLQRDQVYNNQIHIKAQDAKSKKAREIAINDALGALLAELEEINGGRSPYVFIQKNGRRFLSVRTAFSNACKRAGIENFRFHDLRHTFASQLVMAGADLPSVQKLMGHSDIKMTMRYAHLAPGHLKAAVDKLNGFGHFLDTKNRQEAIAAP
jgi:integrase